ncbi:MAG: hypothetical protein PHD37_16190 [Gallionellaceae bacterium]|nr:hypothetical protein [Gallionellaceae bacterium]
MLPIPLERWFSPWAGKRAVGFFQLREPGTRRDGAGFQFPLQKLAPGIDLGDAMFD